MWKDTNIPTNCVPYINSWKLHHPTWEYRFWTDTNILELITNHYDWFLDTYNNYKHNIQRSDVARYIILHHHGGLYCDIDIECYKPVDNLLNGICTVFGENPGDYNHGLTNSIYYAPQHCPFMLRCIKTLKIQRDYKQLSHECRGSFILRTTGCVFLDCLYRRWMHTLPVTRESHKRFEYQLKRHRREVDVDYKPDELEYGVHHSMGSWLS